MANVKSTFSLDKIIGNHKVYEGDSNKLIELLPNESIDILVTSPPYWGQRTSGGMGVEEDPREYIKSLSEMFTQFLPKLKSDGVIWINIGDAYNTPVNWRETDHQFSSLGADKIGLSENNSAYKKNRQKRKAFTDNQINWLTYGNLLALPYRLVISLVDNGFLFRGEVIWKKMNPLPEGRCRRPHRGHESIYLFAKHEKHKFTVSPSVKSVWEFSNEGRKEDHAHFSKFPEELPRRCLMASGQPLSKETVVLDPFSGSGTTGVVAKQLGMSYVGFEIDPLHVKSSNKRIALTEQKNESNDERELFVRRGKLDETRIELH